VIGKAKTLYRGFARMSADRQIYRKGRKGTQRNPGTNKTSKCERRK